MKNRKNIKVLCGLVLSIAISSFLFTSCKKGDIGPAGATGSSGATGASGANGATGANGANGQDGNTILSGEGVPDVTLGVIGDFYLDISTTSLYGPKTASGWGEPVSLKGEQGEAGAAGDNGATATVDTFSIYTEDWMMSEDVYVSINNTDYQIYTAKYAKRYLPHLTRDILDHGMVLVSFTPAKALQPDQWLTIPYTVPGVDPNYTKVNFNYTYLTSEYGIQLQFFLTPLGTTYVYNTIPGAIPTSTDGRTTNTGSASATGSSDPDIEDFQVADARFKVVMIPATVTEEIAAITKMQFTKTGKVLSNF
jgi:hypothetical protein